MTRTADIDLLLASWLAEGTDRAPEERVRAAMLEIEQVGQRRAPIAWRPGGVDGLAVGRLLAAAGIAVIVLLLGVGVGVQTGLIRWPDANEPLPAPLSSAEPDPTNALTNNRTFEAPDGRFTLTVSDRWLSDTGPDPRALYLKGGGLGAFLSIRNADDDGQIMTCDRGAMTLEICRNTAVSNAEDLADAIGFGPTGGAPNSPRLLSQTTTDLEGEQAIVKAFEDYELRGGSEHVTYVVATHDGRLYLIRLWSGATKEAHSGLLEQVLAGFQFSPAPVPSVAEQPSSVDGFRTFVAPDGSFEIRMPEAWASRTGPDPSAVYLVNGLLSLSARGADADRVIRTCDHGAGPWETCPSVSASDLDQLESSIGLRGDRGTVFQGPVRSESTLGGLPAATSWIIGQREGRPRAVQYVMTVRNGRPFIVRVEGPAPQDARIGFGEGLLDGFSFTDLSGESRYVAADGRLSIDLSIETWQAAGEPDPSAMY